jgi:hypothetical protein
VSSAAEMCMNWASLADSSLAEADSGCRRFRRVTLNSAEEASVNHNGGSSDRLLASSTASLKVEYLSQ